MRATRRVLPLLLLLLAAVCKGRRYREHSGGPPWRELHELGDDEGKEAEGLGLVPSNASTSVWRQYTYSLNTFYRERVPTAALLTALQPDAEECAESCLALGSCFFWAWCPAATPGGCQLVDFRSTNPGSLGPGACVIARTNATNDGADGEALTLEEEREPSIITYIAATGPQVPWVSGRWRGVGADCGIFEMRNISSTQDTGVLYTVQPHALYVSVVEPIIQLDGIGSEVECALTCSQYRGCQFWAWCPPEAAGRCGWISQDVTFASLSCVLSFRIQGQPGTVAALVQGGEAVPWHSGFLLPDPNTAEEAPEEVPPEA